MPRLSANPAIPAIRGIGVLLALVLAVAVLGGGVQAQENTISVRASARIQQAGPVTLGEIATLAGPEALRLKALVVVDDFTKEAGADGELRIEFSRVRTTIEKHPGVNMGRLMLSGGASTVRLESAQQQPETSTEGMHKGTALSNTATDAKASEPASGLRARVVERIAQTLETTASNVKLEFPASDASILATSLSGRTVTITPAGAGAQMPVNVRIFEGARIVASGTLRPTVQVRREVLVALAELNRGDGINATTAASETRWISASESPADPVTSTGMTVRTRIASGEVIPARGLESPVIVARGDLISVDCVSGTFVVRAQARAMGPGRVGDVIEFRTQGSSRTFRARIDAPGRAVMVTQASESEPREGSRTRETPDASTHTAANAARRG